MPEPVIWLSLLNATACNLCAGADGDKADHRAHQRADDQPDWHGGPDEHAGRGRLHPRRTWNAWIGVGTVLVLAGVAWKRQAQALISAVLSRRGHHASVVRWVHSATFAGPAQKPSAPCREQAQPRALPSRGGLERPTATTTARPAARLGRPMPFRQSCPSARTGPMKVTLLRTESGRCGLGQVTRRCLPGQVHA